MCRKGTFICEKSQFKFRNITITFVETGKTSDHVVKKWRIEGGSCKDGTGLAGQNTAKVNVTGSMREVRIPKYL